MKGFKRKIAQLKILRKKFESRGKIKNNKELCIYCGLCENMCPVQAIKVYKKEKIWELDQSICVRCSHCVSKCPKDALLLERI